ncbi:holo-ACP synthase [Thiomicrorhabdus sp. 6S3-12]|uniref:holo-ACP synthase n=1 Tax=Thiomicrorhabdus sp. 6S3-12 TaxID=2819681 RepID=UPI001AAD412B|nr:holo-ACP synthase [Thiomicrorhabdus sp. 6S3-12]MBO1924120.1 holo-ACP synthase [Thiomicrorhabdus sp. 6S3-12]
MIVGVGTDIVENVRIAQLFQKQGERFARRLLSDDEWQDFSASQFPESFLAKRWALKEAVAKALGTGIAQGVTFEQMTIAHHAGGQPYLILSGAAQERAQQIQADNWQISVSDEKHYCVAFVVAQSLGL